MGSKLALILRLIPSLTPSQLLPFVLVTTPCVLGFFTFRKTGAWDLSSVFFLYIFLFRLKIRAKPDLPSIFLFLGSALLLGLTCLAVARNEVPLSEAITIGKISFLSATLLLLPRRDASRYLCRHLPLALRVVLLAAATKYSISVLTGLNDRPYLFHENNFELPFFLILYLSVYSKIKIGVDSLLLFVIFAFSGSLSGIAALLYALLFAVRNAMVLLAIPILSLLILAISSSIPERIVEIGGEERVEWVADLISARQDMGLPPVDFFSRPTFLPPAFCESLTHANRPFPNFPERCLSPVLHGNVVRMVVDFGLIPTTLFIFAFLVYLSAVLGKWHAFLFTGIAFINGLSVSGFANQFLIAAFALAICYRAPTFKKGSSREYE